MWARIVILMKLNINSVVSLKGITCSLYCKICNLFKLILIQMYLASAIYNK